MSIFAQVFIKKLHIFQTMENYLVSILIPHWNFVSNFRYCRALFVRQFLFL